MKKEEFTHANRVAWNEAAPFHRQQSFEKLIGMFKQPGANTLDHFMVDALNQIDVRGKAAAQLCCNNGRELLSVKNMGAGECVGFDISDEFIQQAKDICSAASLDCEFVQSDVYAIPSDYNNRFDLVMITIGAVGWLPDIYAFISVIARLLKPGGQLLIYESHPMLDMFEPTDQDPPPLVHSYFRTEPYVDTDGIDYLGGTKYESTPNYWFHHKLSDIFTACLKKGLAITSFEEFDHDISEVFVCFDQLKVKPPLCYMLVAQKMPVSE